MTKTDLARDAGTIAGVALVIAGLWAFWPALALVIAGVALLNITLRKPKTEDDDA